MNTFKFSRQPHQKYCITQYEELAFHHCLRWKLIKLPYFLNLGVKGLILHSLTASSVWEVHAGLVSGCRLTTYHNTGLDLGFCSCSEPSSFSERRRISCSDRVGGNRDLFSCHVIYVRVKLAPPLILLVHNPEERRQLANLGEIDEAL